MPANLVRGKVEQGPILVRDILVLVSEVHLCTIIASHLSHIRSLLYIGRLRT